MKFISIGYYTNGVSVLRFQERDLSILHQTKKRSSSKKGQENNLSHIPKGFTVAVEDESIFVHDALIRRMWTPKGKRPIVTVTGSHQKTCVFGTLTIRR